VLYAAQQRHQLATTGAYAYLRHGMFPILVWMYVRLARREDRQARAEFGEPYARYAATTPAFVPRLRRAASPGVPERT
jgi:protein-S-isoprenylcysteine O-methyltransferase Ste14